MRKKERFLVTGGAGFIGSHIVERLVQDGQRVRVLDNFSSGRRENLSGVINKIELINGDIRNEDICIKASRGMDFVLHQAALRSVPKSMHEPALYNEVNIGGTLLMLQASLKNKVKHFVFASSSSVYGNTESFPEKENFSPQPISPYALTKLCGEHYCRMFDQQYGLAATSLRYFNVFGPRQSLDDEYAVVVPKFISCILNGQRPPIYGTGRQSRDFTFVSNVVKANILALNRLRLNNGIYNVASGKDYRVLELVGILNRLTRKNIQPLFLPARPGDVLRTRADISLAKKEIGFHPSVDFVEGLRLTLEYFQKKEKKNE